MVEELLAQQLDALICWSFPERGIYQILESGLPVICLSESRIRHPLFASPQGFYEAGRMIDEYFARHLPRYCHVLCIGGLTEEPGREDGRTRITGFQEALCNFPDILVQQIPSYWRYEQSYPQIEAVLLAGVLNRIFDLNLTLLAVNRMDSSE